MKIDQLFTREKSNAGLKMPIFDSNGKDTGEWIEVIGAYSDVFIRVSGKLDREMARKVESLDSSTSEDEISNLAIDLTNKKIASLIAGWSFEEECTPENALMLVENAPNIADMVNRFASKAFGVFIESSRPSASGSKRISNSKESQKAPKKRRAATSKASGEKQA